MNSEDLNKIISSIQQKLGDDNAGLIADDIGLLITNNTNVINETQKLNTRIQTLESNNQKLITANGNLLQQIPTGEHYESKKEENKKSFNFYDAFDEKGNFKK